MGNTATRPMDEAPAAAWAGFELPPPPPPTLDALPPDLLHYIAQHLSLQTLSSLGCVSASLASHTACFEELWAALLASHAGHVAARTSDLRAEDVEDAELRACLLPELLRLDASTGGCRRGLATLRARTCVLCNMRAPSGVYFALTRRGVCTLCLPRTGAVDRWIRAQLNREEAARRRLDIATRDALVAALGEALPADLRGHIGAAGGAAAAAEAGGGPMFDLVFDSSRHGGSCTALLRAADGASRTVVLVHAAGGERFGAFVDTEWATRGGAPFFGGPSCFLFSLPRAGGEDGGGGGGSGAGADSERDDICIASSSSSSAPPSSTTASTHRATGVDSNYAHASSELGLGFGGGLGDFGLSIEPDLTRGRVRPCLTYGASAASIFSAADDAFICDTVQLWSVDSPYADHSPRGAARRRRPKAPWEQSGGEGCLEPGENKLMLEFIGMDKELAMLRRYS